ncbi:hypothetical protein CHS0354_030479 [Potamilus streckersoni]|uniref:Protein kinase domain-containing protein n=1 Tax=Potamilus streckersoni TaxID=2493646 RepID=A0AAE0RP89_9BIVA|nr:hypothetical protein CHS0354_030479 [Potamilus streckersoni]
MASASGGISVLVEGIEVSVLSGDLTKQRTSVIVCNTVDTLALKDSQVSAALLDAGGKSLQEECSKKYPKGLRPGEIAEVNPGRLPCLIVYFINIPKATKGDVSHQEEVIRNITKKCLEKANNDCRRTVTFPALGTGKACYQEDLVARTMFKIIEDFSRKNPSSSVKSVEIVIHPDNPETFKTFVSEAKSMASRHGHNGGAAGGQNNKVSLTIAIHRGKLEDWKVDALVCSCSPDMDLSRGGLARSLLDTAGKRLQDECRKHNPSGISPGEVALVDGIGLKCKKVLFGYLLPCNAPAAEQHMSDFISKCLERGSSLTLRSMAFPCLGLGPLGFHPTQSAKVFRKSLDTFLDKNPSSSFESIDIVVYGGTSNWKAVMQAYKDELSKKGSGKEFLLKCGTPNDRPAFATLPRIGLSDLQFSTHDEIGRGGFSVVYHGKWMGTDVAIKKMTLRVNSSELIKMVEQEVSVHSRLRHPHIVQIMGVCSEATSFYIVSEFIDGSDLHNLIFKPGGSRLKLNRKFTFAKQCCQAVAYLHGVDPPIIHQDIKPSNVLVSTVTNQAKICDFGISKIRSYSPGRTTEGTPYFMAPELLIQAGSSSFKSDIWALGCTFLELFTDLDLWAPNMPMVDEDDIMKRMKKNEKPPALPLLDTHLPPSVRKAITDCFEYNPSKRPSALDLVNEFDKHA